MRDDYDEVNNYLRLFNDKLLEKRSDSCDVSSLGNSANIFYYGNIIAVDKTEAARYFKMVADKRNIEVMTMHAALLRNGN